MSADPYSAGHRTSLAMARVLVTYMDDPKAIRKRILEDFERAPAHVTIARMRREYLAERAKPKEPVEPIRHSEAYYPADEAARLEAINLRFLEALERERAISVEWAKAQGALHSPALRNQSIVDKAWDREAELAFRQNTEWTR